MTTKSPAARGDTRPLGKLAVAGAWVRRVDVAIDNAIEPHGCAARGNHCQDNPSHLLQTDAIDGRCQRGSAESERQGEYAVGEFDHPAVNDNRMQKVHDGASLMN